MAITVNMQIAKEIHKDNLRISRKPKLEELDIAFQKELEKGASANIDPIIEQKQILRDITVDPSIESASTPEDLKAAWPEDLLGETPYDKYNQTV